MTPATHPVARRFGGKWDCGMLYLHCGWPRTATSSLQATLAAYRQPLATAGVVYPGEWRVAGGDSHRGVLRVLAEIDGARSGRQLDALRAFLERHRSDKIVISVEGITGWLTEDRLSALQTLIATASAILPVTCLWTLRRYDEVLSSLYLMQLRLGMTLAGFDEYCRQAPDPRELFAGMQRVGEAVAATRYLGYAADGHHNDAILELLELPETTRSALHDRLVGGTRLNPSLTHKAAVALCHHAAIAARTGAPVTRDSLSEAFRTGTLRFDADRPCELAGPELRRDLHARATGAARAVAFAPYLDLFEHDELPVDPPTPLTLDILTSADLRRLARHAYREEAASR